MNQTRLESLIEKITEIISKFFIAWALYAWVILENEWLTHSPFIVTVIFTVNSLVLGYFWRRFYNNGFHKKVHEWFGGGRYTTSDVFPVHGWAEIYDNEFKRGFEYEQTKPACYGTFYKVSNPQCANCDYFDECGEDR